MIKVIFTALVLMLSLLFFNFMFSLEEVTTIGVIDRIEKTGMAVVLIEAESKQIELSVDTFKKSVKEGDVLQLRLQEGGYEVIRIDSDLTNERKQQADELLQQLREKR